MAARPIIDLKLSVVADPIADDPEMPDNPNHANVTGWPSGEKDRQRLLAMQIAAEAALVRAAGA